MYVPSVLKGLSTTTFLLPLLVSAAPAIPTKQAAASGPGNQFLGSLMWYSQQPDLLLATISNNSTSHYALLTKNNLLDDSHPFNPLSVATLSRTPVALNGRRYPYPSIEDAQFRDFPPGSLWQRYFNMSEYIPPSNKIQAPESQCFIFQLPTLVEALAIDDSQNAQHLADIFLGQGLTSVEVASNPIHMNVTVSPATGTAAALAAAQTTIPAQPAGVFLLPEEQTGQVVSALQDPANAGEAPSFVIGHRSTSS
ncbi:MAG: hypothetical protein Q9166_006528 [cf. Caloplaca sp. 2 TL-2023]